MGDMTKNFSSDEFRCKCCGRLKIEPKLVEMLQHIRDTLGAPVIVNSGYRCPRHNKAVGGVKNSDHLRGRAADICSRQSLARLRKAICACLSPDFYYLAYPDKKFFHVGYRPKK